MSREMYTEIMNTLIQIHDIYKNILFGHFRFPLQNLDLCLSNLKQDSRQSDHMTIVGNYSSNWSL